MTTEKQPTFSLFIKKIAASETDMSQQALHILWKIQIYNVMQIYSKRLFAINSQTAPRPLISVF
jgi:hypothetical protein